MLELGRQREQSFLTGKLINFPYLLCSTIDVFVKIYLSKML